MRVAYIVVSSRNACSVCTANPASRRELQRWREEAIATAANKTDTYDNDITSLSVLGSVERVAKDLEDSVAALRRLFESEVSQKCFTDAVVCTT